MLNSTYSLLGTGGSVTASGADAVLANHILTIAGAPGMDYRKITACTGLLAPVAEVLAVVTTTPTAANSTRYELVVRQYRASLGRTITKSFAYTTAASGDTATTICNAFRSMINLDGELSVTTSGTATLIITAVTGAPVVTAVSTGVGTLAVVATTAGVNARGTYAKLVEAGVSGAVSGQTYGTITFVYGVKSTNTVGGNLSIAENKHTVYINAGATNYADLVTRIAEIVAAYNVGAVTSDPEAIAIA